MVEFIAPPLWQCIDFISDLHLDAASPRTAERLTRYLAHTQADAVFFLGDLFEVWVGSEVLESPGIEADLAQAFRRFSQHRTLAFMAGNRDFLVDAAALTHLGMRALPDPTVLFAWGERTLLTHGDAWCLDDADYQHFRTEVRQSAWQEAFLARPYDERVYIARQLRVGSEARKHELGPQAYGDIDCEEARRQLALAFSHRLIHGHTHKPSDDTWSGADDARVTRHVLTDWDCDHATTPRAGVLRLSPAGLQRLAVDEHGHGHVLGIKAAPSANAPDCAAQPPSRN